MLCRTLQCHAHWVNHFALHTDYAMRTGAFEPAEATIVPKGLDDNSKKHLTLFLYQLLFKQYARMRAHTLTHAHMKLSSQIT